MDPSYMFQDILSFDDMNQQKSRVKVPLPGPADPWLINEAIQPPFNTNDSPYGRLSPTLEELTNSLLADEVSLPLLVDTSFDFDVDAALDPVATQNDYSLGDAFDSLMLGSVGPQAQEPSARRRSKRITNKPSRLSDYSPLHLAPLSQYHPQEDDLLESRNSMSPCSSDASSTCSGEGASRPQKKRRPRVSYSTLTEDQRYHRIRDLNNEASRLYRSRIRDQLHGLQQEETKEMEKNQVLKAKAEGLETLRDQVKEFTFNFFREHMGNTGAQ